MRTMKDQLNFFGLSRLGGSSEAKGKRRAVKPTRHKREYEEEPLERPVVIGYLSSLPAQFKCDLP